MHDELAKLIRNSMSVFNRVNSIYINKKMNSIDFSGEVIYINSINSPSQILPLSNSSLVDYEVEITYINFKKSNQKDIYEKRKASIKNIILSNLHNSPYWYYIDFSIEDDIDIENYDGEYQGFRANLNIKTIEV